MDCHQIASMLHLDVKPFLNADGTADSAKVSVRGCSQDNLRIFLFLTAMVPLAVVRGAVYTWLHLSRVDFETTTVKLTELNPVASPAKVAKEAAYLAALAKADAEMGEKADGFEAEGECDDCCL